ncbi:hypothetical protein KP509_18G064800 [Ceratopteris richardii]|uniref:Uncharacterized protein n=1 Tax=Ceratopteris richardii TaxID=49495 RepID=A0A8T2SSH7_CERRI|nr:hypothetical protein KP509_18G064800 [Ceratopteris richardii]
MTYLIPSTKFNPSLLLCAHFPYNEHDGENGSTGYVIGPLISLGILESQMGSELKSIEDRAIQIAPSKDVSGRGGIHKGRALQCGLKKSNITERHPDKRCPCCEADFHCVSPCCPVLGMADESSMIHAISPFSKAAMTCQREAQDEVFLKDEYLFECDDYPYLKELTSPQHQKCGVDIASLQYLPDIMTPCKEVSLSRALSLNRSPYTNVRPPLVPTPRLNNTPCSPCPRTNKLELQRYNVVDSNTAAKGTPAHGNKQGEFKENAYMNTLDYRKSTFRTCSENDASKIDTGFSVWQPGNALPYNTTEDPAVTSSSLTTQRAVEKFHIESENNAFVSHILRSTSDSPESFSSNSHRDWRSRSLGRSVNLKSTVRNLEVAFSRYRSDSLQSSNMCMAKIVSASSHQMDDAGTIEFIPMDMNIDKDQPCIRNRSEGQVSRKFHESRNKGLCKVQSSRKLASLCSEPHSVRSFSNSTAMKALPPITQKQQRHKFELLCRPSLPVAHSVYHVPGSRGTLYSEKLCSTGHISKGVVSGLSRIVTPSILQAVVQCTSIDDVTSYTMTVDGTDEMFIARDCMHESLSISEPRVMYTIYSGKVSGTGSRGRGWRRWTKRENKDILDLAGILQVSSTNKADKVHSELDREHMFLEFVLYDGMTCVGTQSQSLRIHSSNMPCHKMSSRVLSSKDMSFSVSHTIVPARLSHCESMDTESTSIFVGEEERLANGSVTVQPPTDTPRKGDMRHRATTSLDKCNDSDAVTSFEYVSHLPSFSHKELAAIVMKVPRQRCQGELKTIHGAEMKGGWGLKFLNASTDLDTHTNLSGMHSPRVMENSTHLLSTDGRAVAEASISGQWCYQAECKSVAGDYTSCALGMRENSTVLKRKSFHQQAGLTKWLSVILPLGEHGLPSEGMKGPSSLIERWESGGSCECGGWDLGCGIEVLHADKPNSHGASQDTASVLLQNQPINLFLKESNELMFSLQQVEEGQYRLKFQEKFLSLRAFATALSVICSSHMSLRLSPSKSSIFSSATSTPLTSVSKTTFTSKTISTPSTSTSISPLPSPASSSPRTASTAMLLSLLPSTTSVLLT